MTRVGEAAADWLKELQTLIWRHPEQGIGADLASLTIAELWGIYRFLKGQE